MMTKEELISKCRREMTLKDSVIQKLLAVGQVKGIDLAPQASKRSARQDLKRHEEMWEQRHRKEVDGYKLTIKEMDQQVHYLNEQLYEEQMKRELVESSLRDSKVNLMFLLFFFSSSKI